jgi:hypothetical protein
MRKTGISFEQIYKLTKEPVPKIKKNLLKIKTDRINKNT